MLVRTGIRQERHESDRTPGFLFTQSGLWRANPILRAMIAAKANPATDRTPYITLWILVISQTPQKFYIY
jgi:hypothetical protein